jgi:hypothetical protein
MTRRPLLMAAALGVAAIPIVLLTLPDRPRPQEVRQDLKTFDAQSEPPRAAAARVAMPAMPAPPPPPAAPDSSAPRAQQQLAATADPLLPEVAPRVAYTYGFRFRVPTAALASVQERHLRLCLEMGQARCRIVSMRRSETRPDAPPPPRDHGYGGGQPEPQAPAASLEVQVAAPLADEFGRRLTASAGEAGGETVDRQIGADDVSREMVDSEARIRTRETLIRRLSALLETRSGNIDQAVQAERAINAAQEELDSARTWLAETRGRVAMSRIAIFYESPGAAAVAAERDPIGKALSQARSIAAQSIAVLLFILALTLPWAAIALLISYFVRRYRRTLAPSLPSE